MKYILQLCLVLPFFSSAQTTKVHSLKLNEKMPNIKLHFQGESQNKEIADFKGRLLIFDFWGTTCASCFYHFPKMETLQKEFGDKIQIILVNVQDSQEEIDAMPETKRKKLPSLPSIVGDKQLLDLFPHEYAGYYVWIDTEGYVKLLSSVPKNNSAEKIREAISLKDITILNVGKYYQESDSTLYQMLGKHVFAGEVSSSIFAGFDPDYGVLGGKVVDVIDATKMTIRSTYINTEVLELIHEAYYPLIETEWKTCLLGPYDNNPLINHINLIAADSLKYTSYFVPSSEETDVIWTKSRVCYEQIRPFGISEGRSLKYMREDLDRYIFHKYKCSVNIDTMNISCFEIFDGGDNKLSVDKRRTLFNITASRQYKGSISSVVKELIQSFYKAKSLPYPYVFSKINHEKDIDVYAPEWTENSSIFELTATLKAYGVELIGRSKKINMITVNDAQ